jgi:hypothetical protein
MRRDYTRRESIMISKPGLAPLALVAALTLAGCGGGDPVDSADPTAPVVETPTATATPAEPVDEAEVFLTLSARMTEVTGQQLSATLTVYEPRPESESADLISALDPACVVYTSNRAEDAAGSPEPAWFGHARLTVTGDDTWSDDHAVRIDTGGRANIGAGEASWFADNITCANLLVGAGTSTFATYFPLNYAEGGIEGALNWSIMGFSDQGDAGGVTYDECSVELSAHAQSLSPAESGWSLHHELGCYMSPNY